MSAAILCLAVCVCDLINKAGMSSTSVKYTMNYRFLFFILKSQHTWLPPEELKFKAQKPKQKQLLFHECQTYQAYEWKRLHISYISSQFASLHGHPFEKQETKTEKAVCDSFSRGPSAYKPSALLLHQNGSGSL